MGVAFHCTPYQCSYGRLLNWLKEGWSPNTVVLKFIIFKGIQFYIGCLYSPVIRGEPFQILASTQVSVPLISRPVGSYWEGGATPL